jgi:hypothetical protein
MVERRVREARFPTVKSLDSFDFPAIPSLNKALVLELARGEYIERRENVIALGNSGTGKTHVSIATPDPRPRGKTGGALSRGPDDVIVARVRRRHAGAGPSLSSRLGSGPVGVIQQ